MQKYFFWGEYQVFEPVVAATDFLSQQWLRTEIGRVNSRRFSWRCWTASVEYWLGFGRFQTIQRFCCSRRTSTRSVRRGPRDLWLQPSLIHFPNQSQMLWYRQIDLVHLRGAAHFICFPFLNTKLKVGLRITLWFFASHRIKAISPWLLPWESLHWYRAAQSKLHLWWR
jgi:hypothetical protein